MSKYCEWCGGLMICADCTPVKEVSRDLISRKVVVEMLEEKIEHYKNKNHENWDGVWIAGMRFAIKEIQTMPGAGEGEND